MTIPNHLNSSFRYKETIGVTDVATVITDFRAETVTSGSPAWTEPSSNLFKSPTDADGRFFDVLLTRVDATTLEWRVRDQNAATICTRRIQIDAAGTTIRIYSGQYHAWVDALRATPEELWAGILDLSPLAQSAHSNYVYGNGRRTTANTVDGSGSNYDQAFMLDNGTAAIAVRVCRLACNLSTNVQQGPGGEDIFSSAEVLANMSGTVRRVGRYYQAFEVDGAKAAGAELDAPIDSGVTGTFKVVGNAANSGVRLCLRKA